MWASAQETADIWSYLLKKSWSENFIFVQCWVNINVFFFRESPITDIFMSQVASEILWRF